MTKRSKTDFQCLACAQKYVCSQQAPIPELIIRSSEEARADRYEDSQNRHAEHYAGLWAFGYYFLRRGEAEGLYRTVHELIVTALPEHYGEYRLLEIGCGVGRTTCDMARHFTCSLVIGIDCSRRMLRQAYELVVDEDKMVEISLANEGFGTVTAPSFGLSNVIFAQADAMDLPFMTACFDLVVGANVIDRTANPERVVREAARVLKPGGYLVLATPLNWSRQPDWWPKYRAQEQIEDLLRDNSFAIDLSFDGLLYREVVDVRGAYTDWSTTVIRAVKTG
jgi:ubiquinone/menaquinone biosynthesis C-methylase UbiE